MPLKNITFDIPIYTDKKIYDLFKTINEKSEYNCNTIIAHTYLGGQPITCNFKEAINDEEIKNIFSQNAELIETFRFQFTSNIEIYVRRTLQDLEQTLNRITINISPLDESLRNNLYSLTSLIKKSFKAVNSSTFAASILNKDIKRQYETRENELVRLEQLSETIIDKQLEYQNKIDDEFKKKKLSLEKDYEDKGKKLEEKYEKDRAGLEKEKIEVDKRFKEIDNRQSKHVRRELRNELKKEFKARSEEFELTEGTKNRRKPIQRFTLILLTFFGLGLIYYTSLFFTFVLFEPITVSSVPWSITIKQLAFAVAFGSTSIYYLRWNNKWFEQHANEEFKLKKYDIDLDRASWLVEMALEWNEEIKTDIPFELLDKLSHNLFDEEKTDDTELHPSEQLASAIFGASSNATIKLPGGSELSLDRKGIKDLRKSKN